jgi:hypothetical protein
MKLQAHIEAILDQADVCERQADFAHAVECLDRARALSGLSFACLAQRARCVRELEGRSG